MTRNHKFLAKMHLYKQDLLNIKENVPIRHIIPYNLVEPWDHSIDTVFRLLQQERIQRNRIMVLSYTYSLGELLSLKTLPRFAWLEYVRRNDISEEYQYFLGATRTYRVFKEDPEQMYRTDYLSSYVLARMSKDNFENNFMLFV